MDEVEALFPKQKMPFILLLACTLTEVPKGDTWTAPAEETDWWQWRASSERREYLSVPAHPSLPAYPVSVIGVLFT